MGSVLNTGAPPGLGGDLFSDECVAEVNRDSQKKNSDAEEDRLQERE